MSRIPTIGEMMTACPRTIGEDIPVSTAKELMRRDGIRHLPVLSAGHLVGIISDRDIKVAAALTGQGDLTVAEVMTDEPYTVPEDEPLDRVLLTMAEKKFGCALVHHRGSENIIGIFTDTDALKAYGTYLDQLKERRAA